MKTLLSDERAGRLSGNAVLLASAMILSFVETLVPLAALPLPGFKAGLANIAVTAAAFRYSVKDAAAVSFVRCILTFLIFGSPTSLMFSICGGALVILMLAVLKTTGVSSKMSFIGLSVLCALAHNAGQYTAALVLVGRAVNSYIPVLIAASAFYGSVNGIIMNLLPEFIYAVRVKK